MAIDLTPLTSRMDFTELVVVVLFVASALVGIRVCMFAARVLLNTVRGDYSDSQYEAHAEANRQSGNEGRPW